MALLKSLFGLPLVSKVGRGGGGSYQGGRGKERQTSALPGHGALDLIEWH